MATLEKIRSKAGIIVAAVIGFALLAFVMQDFFSSGKSIFRGTDDKVGEISGKKISYQDYLSKIEQIKENDKLMYGRENADNKMDDQFREQAWQEIVNETVLFKEFDKVGISVSSDELSDLFIGKDPSFRIRQIFTNPQTGEFMRAAVQQFLKVSNENPEGDQMKVRLVLEKEIINYRAMAKYNNLIVKGITAPAFMVRNEFTEDSKKVDFSYLVQRYTSIPDSAVKITASDMKKYYKEHKYLYEQTASRDVEYVSFDVVPSQADIEAAQDWIAKIRPDFVSATEVETFVNQNSDVAYTDHNYKQGELSDSLDAFMFKASVGDVYGPYLESESYKLARLYNVADLPDSVEARHILIAPKEQTEGAVKAAKALADSIKDVLEKDKKADFAALAQKYSDDKGSAAKGGDLGWFKEGKMVKPFSDAAFEAKKDEIKMVETSYGYHIIQVMERGKEGKKVKVAIIERKLVPSQHTFDQTYARANKFASENRTIQQFNGAVTKQNLSKRIAPGIGENDKSLPGLDQARELIKWAYSAKKGEVSEPLTIGDRYIIASLVEVKDKGTAELEQVRSDVELAVRRLKKAEKITENLNKLRSSGQSIDALALKLKSPVETAIAINFSTFQLPGAGVEPKVIAASTCLPKNKISEPIDGNNGVYVIYITNIDSPQGKDYTEAKQRLNTSITSKASYEVYNALIKIADIDDKHMRFF
jgi:peptidyl-prolyl cis-trans isomerase D